MKVTGRVEFDCNDKLWKNDHKVIIRFSEGNLNIDCVAYMKGRQWENDDYFIEFDTDISWLSWYLETLMEMKNNTKQKFDLYIIKMNNKVIHFGLLDTLNLIQTLFVLN